MRSTLRWLPLLALMACDSTVADSHSFDTGTQSDPGSDTATASDTASDTGTDTASDTGSDTQATLMAPDFGLLDVNTASLTAGQLVSPRDYLQQVSGWYFTHAT